MLSRRASSRAPQGVGRVLGQGLHGQLGGAVAHVDVVLEQLTGRRADLVPGSGQPVGQRGDGLGVQRRGNRHAAQPRCPTCPTGHLPTAAGRPRPAEPAAPGYRSPAIGSAAAYNGVRRTAPPREETGHVCVARPVPFPAAARGGRARGSVGGEPTERFLLRYYRHVATEDLLARAPEDLLGAALSHKQLAASRPARHRQRARVHARPWSRTAGRCGHSVIEIVTDDMPFLVDSVTAELSRQERAVHLVVHPQLVVRRDATGVLQEILDVDVAPQRASSADAHRVLDARGVRPRELRGGP